MSQETSLNLAERLAAGIDVVRLVVISDIHATDKGNPLTNVAKSDTRLEANALVAAGELLQSEFETADVVVCPGDLVHEGDTTPVGWVWEQLGGISERLGAALIGAAGNHDLTRKPKGGRAAFDALQGLRPLFPIGDEAQWNSYWAADFAVLNNERARLVSMNTCSTHGGYDPDEEDFGRFKAHALQKLHDYLEGSDDVPDLNVCVLHHHPVEWTHNGDKERTHLQRGDLLIDTLMGRPERWMLIHGHKHHPRIIYLGGTTNGPVCLAAGSIGADVLSDTGTTVRNQLHVVDLAVDGTESLGLRLAGEVFSFDWEPGNGWGPATAWSGLPERCAFGYRRDAMELVSELWAELEARGERSITWPEIVSWDHRWHFLTPGDREAVFQAVRAVGGGVTGVARDDELQVTRP